MSYEASVQTELDTADRDGAQALVTAVRAAGERAADAGLGTFKNDPAAFQPKELWTFELARDLLAHLAGLDGVDRDAARLGREIVADYSDSSWQSAFDAAAEQLGPPPTELANLRAVVAPISRPAAPAIGSTPPEPTARRHFWKRS